MKTIVSLILLGAAVFCPAADKMSPADQKAADEVIDFGKYAMTEEAFRKMAIQNAADAGKVFFNPRAAIRWARLVNEYSQLCISDFFTGAVVLRGKFDKTGAVGAFYNPFWDALFIFQSSGLPEVPVISSFYFIPGEAFRNEKYSGEPDYSMIVSMKDPVTVNILKKTMLTLQKFDSTLTQNKDYEEFLDYEYSDKNDEIIQVRAGMRLKLKAMLLKNPKHRREAYAMCTTLRRSNVKQLTFLFSDDNTRPMAEMFCQLPDVFKKDFTPYLYVPTKEGRLYIMVNKEYPRLIVSITIYNNGTNYAMEWYDLNDAEKVIKVWNSRKENK